MFFDLTKENFKDIFYFKMPGICSKCQKSVFQAEETKALGKVWHTSCFLCANCNKRLSSINATNKDGKVFCKLCYAKLFAPNRNGYTKDITGTLDLSILATQDRINSLDLSHNILNSIKSNGTSEKHVPYLARSRYASPTRSPLSRSASPRRPYKASYQFKNFRYGDKTCGRCNKTVYLTENVYGAGAEQSWHQACFKCNKCGKRLDSISVQTYEGEIYCISCSNNYQFARKKF